MSLSTFEADLLSVFLKNRKKYIKFSTKIKEEHFRNEVLRWTYKVLSNYFSKFKDLPTIKVFQSELLKTSFSSEKKKQYFIVIKKLFKRKVKTSLKYMEKNVEEKIDQEEFLVAVDKSLREIEKGNISKAKKELLTNLIMNTPNEGDTIRVLQDWESRQILREELSKIPAIKRFISTPYKVINVATQGIQVSEAATVAGVTGMGKSIVAGEFGVNSFLEGLNVLHFTLENLAEQTAQRYDSRLSEIEYDTIKLYEFDKSQLSHFRKVFKSLSSRMKNDVVIKETVKDETSIVMVDKVLELLKLEGFDTEFLIIDSCDLMSAVKNYDSHRLDRASIYWDFKFYLKAKRLPGLTTTQLKATSRFKLSTVEDLAEAYDKARILDIIYIMNQSEEQAKDNILTLALDKNRDGPGGVRVDLYRDYKKMRLLEIK